jgi:signal transduction histidine kinase
MENRSLAGRHYRNARSPNYDRTIPQILAYGSELNQVWTNLIDNAIDAIGNTGTISIETEHLGDRLEVHISDSGAGIPNEVRSHS